MASTKPVTLDVVAVDCGDSLDLVGDDGHRVRRLLDPRPDAPGISTQDHGLLEVKLTLDERLMDDVRVSPTVTIPAAELAWRFSRSSGAGGQHVNTTDSRVELTWDLDGRPR